MHPRNILTSCLLLLILLPAAAQARQRDAQKERQSWEHLRLVAPASVETFKRATEAFDANNYAEAARLYAEVLEAAPDFTPALRRGGVCGGRDGAARRGDGADREGRQAGAHAGEPRQSRAGAGRRDPRPQAFGGGDGVGVHARRRGRPHLFVGGVLLPGAGRAVGP